MTEIQCLKVRLRQDKVEEAVRWVKSLKQRPEEMAELLEAEGVSIESIFLERCEQEVYLYQYVRAGNLEQAHQAFTQSPCRLAAETRQFVDEMWEDGQSLELLADFDFSGTVSPQSLGAAKTMSNHVRVVARVVALPEKIEQVKSILMGLVEPTRQEEGCILYELLQNHEDSTDFTFIEEWESPAQLDNHLASAHIREAQSKLDGLVAFGPDIRFYQLLA